MAPLGWLRVAPSSSLGPSDKASSCFLQPVGCNEIELKTQEKGKDNLCIWSLEGDL